jgi:hypothetical protein
VATFSLQLPAQRLPTASRLLLLLSFGGASRPTLFARLLLQPAPTEYQSESAATVAAAVLAANAAAAAAAEEARKRSMDRGGAGVTLGKRKRKPRRDEDYVDPNSEEDEELKGEAWLGAAQATACFAKASLPSAGPQMLPLSCQSQLVHLVGLGFG